MVYSDDHGATWQGGEELVLLPQFGGGWTIEVAGRHPGDLVHRAAPAQALTLTFTFTFTLAQVAELTNGSVLLTSRNFYGRSSGYGLAPACSDDGGSWAANWAQTARPILRLAAVRPRPGTLLFGNLSHARCLNFSVHASDDGGRTWPRRRPGSGRHAATAQP